VVVAGESDIAELIVSEVVELFWSTTGFKKRWETLQSHVRLKSYATLTKVDLGVPLEQFLNPSLDEFMRNKVVGGTDNYGLHMSARSYRDNFGLSKNKAMTYTVDNVDLLVHIFDTGNGRSEQLRFNFRARTADEQGYGIFGVYSELPYEQHVACLSELKAGMTADTH
jgi:hypothetical protein